MYIRSLLAIALLCLCRHCIAQPDFNKQLTTATTDAQKESIYIKIFDHYKGYAGDSARPFLEKGLADFTGSSYKHGQATMLLLLSNVHSEKGLVVMAREQAQQALKLFIELKDEQYAGKAHNSIGNAESYLGNYPQAIDHFLKALKKFERLRDTLHIVNTYLELGAANDFNGNHDKALGYYHKALDLALRTKPTANIVYLYNNIGLYYARNGKFEEAKGYFEKAEQVGRNPEFAKARRAPLINLGKVYNAMGNNRKALEYLNEAMVLAKRLQMQEPVIRTLLEIGQIETTENPTNTASLQEGLLLAKQMDSKRLQADLLQALAVAADKRGDYKEEVALLKEVRVLRDSVFNINKAKEIANLQSEYELKQTSNQLAALEKSEQRNAQKKNLIIIIAGVLAAALLALLVFYTRSRRLNGQLKIREQDLQKANAVKDRIFSIIGHDLKGPIGNIPSLLQIYKNGGSDEEKAYILRTMEESSQASLDTLEKLLNWGQQQIKGNTYTPTILNAGEIMEQKLRLLGVAAANKNIMLKNSIPLAMQVYADENHFKFIMRNLISNAVKFTHAGGHVEISAEQEDGAKHITFSVKDNGVGIPKEKQEQIFQPHNKSTRGTANETGTSLGLMLCKEFVLQNGGNIWVESTPNEGTVFSFTVLAN